MQRKVLKYVLTVLAIVLMTSMDAQDLRRFHQGKPRLGTWVTLTVYCQDSLHFAAVSQRFFDRLDSLNGIFSDYAATSEVSRLNASGAWKQVRISASLSDLLHRSLVFAHRTGGVVDPTVGKLTHLWKDAFATNRMPSRRKIRKALRVSGYSRIELDTAHRILRRDVRGLQFDFGAMGKGYIGDLLSTHLDQLGYPYHLLDLGGDLVAGDSPPGEEGWKVELVDGSIKVLSRSSIATSGTTYQYLEHRGRKYSHLIDTRSGYGLSDPTLCTVVAPDGFTADAAASALPFLTAAERSQLAREYDFLFLISSQNTVTNGAEQ